MLVLRMHVHVYMGAKVSVIHVEKRVNHTA